MSIYITKLTNTSDILNIYICGDLHSFLTCVIYCHVLHSFSKSLCKSIATI